MNPMIIYSFSLRQISQIFLTLAFFLALTASSWGAVTYVDDSGENLKFSSVPKRVISLVPGFTEIMCGINAGKSLLGITEDDSYFECLIGKTSVGPAQKPNFNLIASLNPDLLIVSKKDLETVKALDSLKKIPLLVWENPSSLLDLFSRIKLLGEIFRQQPAAQKLILEGQDFVETIRLKTLNIPESSRKRTLRFRSLDGVPYTGAEDSLDTLLITAAGGIPPQIPGTGLVPLTGAEFLRFNPEFIYANGNDAPLLRELSQKSPWSRVKAIKEKRIGYFPEALTERLSAHGGYFIAWLSSSLYEIEYGDPENFVYPQEILTETPIALPKAIPYLQRARLVEFRLTDFTHRSLLIDLNSPQKVISTGDGVWENVLTVGNTGSPPMVWAIRHKGGWEETQDLIFQTLNLKKDQSSLIFTGADLRNLSIKEATYKDITIVALVTAGAEGNAVRTSRDKGAFYEPGTINIILLSSRAFTPGGAASAIIVITEAKTAALWDMDIRSTETPQINPATGTGTDDIIVVTGGRGKPVDYTGGHGKIGELIAKVVYAAVTEALQKQNGKALHRSVWERLNERGVKLSALGGPFSREDFVLDLKNLFLTPSAQSLIETAFSLDDALVMTQLTSLEAFNLTCLAFLKEHTGNPNINVSPLIAGKDLPPALTLALNTLGTALLSTP